MGWMAQSNSSVLLPPHCRASCIGGSCSSSNLLPITLFAFSGFDTAASRKWRVRVLHQLFDTFEGSFAPVRVYELSECNLFSDCLDIMVQW